ncbi:MAG: hypothetical protein K8J31_26320, partial [Anaerolineae bacterium]|nr:hypothetical protein [Anaerolineae bacterium]
HHWIMVPEDLPVGRYTLAAGLFRLLQNERLPVSGKDTDPEQRVAWASDLRYAPPEPQITGQPPLSQVRFGDLFTIRSLDVHRNDQELHGVMWDVVPGDTLTLDVFWETLERPALDYSVFLHLSAAADAPPVSQADSPMGGPFPTGAWRPGDLVHDRLTLVTPEDTPTGTYDLLLGTYFWQTGERLSVTEGGRMDPDQRIVLGQVTVHTRQ